MGSQLPLPKTGESALFSAHVYCGQTAAWIKVSLGVEVGPDTSDIVLDGDPAPPPQNGSKPWGTASQFSAHVCCGQTAGWTKKPLGKMVGLGPGNIVLDADPAPPARDTAPNFGPCLL